MTGSLENTELGLTTPASAKVTSLNVNNEYDIPTTDGTAGQVLTTDGSGSATWQDVPSSGVDVVVGTQPILEMAAMEWCA